MKIEHAALYVQDLEGAKCFFETYFEAKSNQLYHNQKTVSRTFSVIGIRMLNWFMFIVNLGRCSVLVSSA